MHAHTDALTALGADDLRTYRELLASLSAALILLPDKPEETAESTLRALWLAAAGAPCSVEAAMQTAPTALNASAAKALRDLVRRRCAGEPLAYLTGRQRFMGLELLAGPGALIPRKETELLGHLALNTLQTLCAEHASPLVVDACTGSGNLALAMAHHAHTARVFGADLSQDAVDQARGNAALLGLSQRVTFRQGDLLAPFETPEFLGQVDLLICNPPYISTRKVDIMADEVRGHEPRLAFDGGPLGIKILFRLIQEAPRFLRPGGYLAFEVGAGQGPNIQKRVRGNSHYVSADAVNDEHGEPRAILARLAG